MNYDKNCQLLIIGDSTVGKTSLITRYANGIFKEEYLATVGIDYFTKEETINNQSVQVKLWDTAGQERFKSLTQNFFRNAQGVILAFDVTNTESFDNLKDWINSIKKNIEGNNIFIPLIIVGNKIDMEDAREIQKDVAEKFASQNKYKYFETSAKTGEGVDDAVRDIVTQVLSAKQSNDNKDEGRSSVQIKAEQKGGEKKKGCC